MMLAKYVYETFTHITIDTTLNGVFDWGNATLDFKKNVEQPFRICIEMFPVSNKHIIANGNIAVIHGLFKSRYVLWGTLFDNLTKYFPVFSDMVFTVLLRIANTPMTCDRKDDVVFSQQLL